ncbi:hypothetical protein T4C_10043 [Trichinella pseudospiralis]|uniref:Uncharacterized protein n=1 Tax=Trichinella pseudospiralis TaxID=6337 RepID=A0A0V1JCR7_TRIPS|nr:hypothetical protein T4C_10043 [Trichinella pseudospiralis]
MKDISRIQNSNGPYWVDFAVHLNLFLKSFEIIPFKCVTFARLANSGALVCLIYVASGSVVKRIVLRDKAKTKFLI